MSKLGSFFEEIQSAKEENLLFSLHMKATMMKVSDPIFFGNAFCFINLSLISLKELEKVGVDVNNGSGNLFAKINELPSSLRDEINMELSRLVNPDLAMVDSDNGITNLHVPSDVIIDASMPAMIEVRDKCGIKMDNYKIQKPLFEQELFQYLQSNDRVCRCA